MAPRRDTEEALWALAAIAVLAAATVFNIRIIQDAWGGRSSLTRHLHDYSYVEYNFPETLVPLARHPFNARLAPEDTVYYAVNATAEWHSMFPPGGGFVRLGPASRLFGVSMFHQLHCLDKMRRAINGDVLGEWDRWHAQHCINYLRQMVLCSSSMRLEPMHNSPGGLKTDGLGLEHTCRDWGLLYELAEENFAHWPADAFP